MQETRESLSSVNETLAKTEGDLASTKADAADLRSILDLWSIHVLAAAGAFVFGLGDVALTQCIVLYDSSWAPMVGTRLSFAILKAGNLNNRACSAVLRSLRHC
jgi:hypothetical protein